MSRIPNSKLVRTAQLALQPQNAGARFNRVATIANTMAAGRHRREEQNQQDLQADLRESEQLKVLRGISDKLVTPELAYLHSYHHCLFNDHSKQTLRRDLSDGGTLLAKQKLIPSSDNLSQAQKEQNSTKDRRGQLVDILV